MTTLTDSIFTNEDAARAHFEALRWPDGRICPHCGVIGNSTLMQGKSTRPGLYKCKACRKPFTAMIGTVYEKSHIPLHKWLLATQLIVSSKKGISAHQLYRQLGFGSYRTAWFMAHSIREAMTPTDLPPMGEEGGIVEVDETFIGREPGVEARKGGFQHKMKVLSLLDRTTGEKRSIVIDKITIAEITPILRENIAKEAHLLTDDAGQYRFMSRHFASHRTTPHMKGVYVDTANPIVHTNTIEGSFSIFKRGMRGIYQHCGKQHLHRYVAEFDFRYTHRVATGCNDHDRACRAIVGTIGKRLTYQQSNRMAA